MQVVIFDLNDERFAVETSRVQNISDMMDITKVPKAPSYIKGLINLRGNIISLLDLNLLLDIQGNEKEQENIIILELEDEFVGITVDRVDEVLEIEENSMEKFTDNSKKPYIKGIIKLEDEIVTVIDIDKLMSN